MWGSGLSIIRHPVIPRWAMALLASSRDRGQVMTFPSSAASPGGLGGGRRPFLTPSRHILEETETKRDIHQCLTPVNGRRVEASIEK